MKTKVCYTCKQEKPLDEYKHNKHNKDGYSGSCKKCLAAYHKNYCIEHLDERKQYLKDYTQKNTNKLWYANIVKSHKRDGCEINFTFDELNNLIQSTPRCKYCGSELDYTTTYGNRTTIPLNNKPSVDRINGNKCLTIDNIEIICYKCNATKLDRTEKEFYEYCKKVCSILEKS